MILVVCPNLAIDVTLEIRQLSLGGVHRAQRARRQAGGKGVNAARAITRLGERAIVVGFAGGARGAEIARGLDEEGLDAHLVPIDGQSRTCTILLEPSGVATVVNEEGPAIERPASVDALLDAVGERVPKARAVAVMGSLQPGLPSDLHASIIERSRRAGKPSLVDTSGAALRAALAAGPTIVKPNRIEAEGLLGRPLKNEAECVRAASELRAAGADIALVTRGADGAIVSSASGAGRCTSDLPKDIRLGNPTGAGDALAAGLLVGLVRGLPLEDVVRLGVAAATASLAEGYGRFRARDVRIESARFAPIDPDPKSDC